MTTTEHDEAMSVRDALTGLIDDVQAWCDAIQENGTSWDDWDEHYKNLAYRGDLDAYRRALALAIAPATDAGFAAGMRRAAEIARQRAMYLSLKEDYGDEVIQARHEGSSDELRSIADAILAVIPSAPPAGDSDVTVPKWRPIETAPKDGSVMLAYNGDIFLMVLWVSTGCWQEWSSREPYDNYRPLTHWMSLRDLPDPDDDNSLATLPSAPPASEGE